MIYIIQVNNGEQYENYRAYNSSIWQVADDIDVDKQYREYIQSKLNRFNIVLDNRTTILHPVVAEDINYIGQKKIFKNFHKVVEENPIEKYLDMIGGVRLPFKELEF